MKKNKELTTREILKQVIVNKHKELGLPTDKLLTLQELSEIVEQRSKPQPILPDEKPLSENEMIDMLAQSQVIADEKTDDTVLTADIETTEVVDDTGECDGTATICVQVPSRFSPEFAKKFSSLDKEWQDYLCSLDADICRELADMKYALTERQWVDVLHHIKSCQRLSDSSETPREWVEKMAFVEYMLETNPREALNTLAKIYIPPHPAEAYQRLIGRMFCPVTVGDYFACQRRKMANHWIDSLLAQKDESGALKFPYHATVRNKIIRLLQTGQATDIKQAYDMAIWCDDGIREKLVQQKVSDLIRSKAAEVRQAKKAAFAPSGTGRPEAFSPKGRTTREILEEAFRKCKYGY